MTGRTGDARAHAQLADARALLDSWVGVPAFVRDRHLTVTASNGLARAVSPGFAVGVNLARFAFLDPSVAGDAQQWPGVADEVAALLRDSLDRHEQDAAFRSIVGELSATSRAFAEAWADESVPVQTGSHRFPNDAVGTLRLTYHQLMMPDNYDDTLVVWRPSDEESRAALARLAELAAG
jgi:hypothetical protein